MKKCVKDENLDYYRAYPEEEIDEGQRWGRAFLEFLDARAGVEFLKIMPPEFLQCYRRFYPNPRAEERIWEEPVLARLTTRIHKGKKLLPSEREFVARLVEEYPKQRQTKRRRGRPSMSRGERAFRDCRISESVSEYREQGLTRERAIEKAARDMAVSESEARKALLRWTRLEKIFIPRGR